MLITHNDQFKNSLLSRHVCDVMCWIKRSEFSLASVADAFCGCWEGREPHKTSATEAKFSCGRTVLQYCCCLITILTAWKTFMKISHRKGRVRNDRDVMCLLAHDVMVSIFVTFKMCYEHFHSTT